MIATQAQQFARVLTDKRVELGKQLRSRDRITIETSPDELEERVLAAERELALVDLGRVFSTCRQIEAALERVQNDSFGVCLSCEREIGQRRLHALPWAALCVKCQEAVERSGGHDEDQLFDLAA
jgi:DnaK suppressor protein